ncbi:nucleoside deaminase [Providencia sneebia]|uniref:CMP/dCMP-type deaminase domain-containing protein n=1 Tax=Providencia sneebia DSM 19967 TaxID=1141660 RepID=K8WH84_9GAMM|nr:nucleoside deaminase [Providencia sneebia]EKT59918.1 hypothetical protein OO7_03769 [Providencia sneebia DSM 19967]
MSDKKFIEQAIQLAKQNIDAGGRPFGAVVVKNDKVIATGVNQMLELSDPTAHAELLALREAGRILGNVKLNDCVVYASGQPCPMCLAAMRMSGITRIVYAYSNDDAEAYGLSTASIASILREEPQNQPGLDFIQLKPDEQQMPLLYQYWVNCESTSSKSS